MVKKDESTEEILNRVKKEVGNITQRINPIRDHYLPIDFYAAEVSSPFREFNHALGQMRSKSTEQMYGHLKREGVENGYKRDYNGKSH